MKLKELTTPLNEASYHGNIGMVEMFKFYEIADQKQKELMKKLLDKKHFDTAWKFLQKVTGVKLQ
jgi:hypothetical protein